MLNPEVGNSPVPSFNGKASIKAYLVDSPLPEKKFTKEALFDGLRRLIREDGSLHFLNDPTTDPDPNDVFKFPRPKKINNNRNRRKPDVSCELGLDECDISDDEDGVAILCACGAAIVCGTSYVVCRNSCDTLNNEEPSCVQITKVVANFCIFAGLSGLIWSELPQTYGFEKQDEGRSFAINALFSLWGGSTAAALWSYAGKKMTVSSLCSAPDPVNKEILEQLAPVKMVLKRARSGHNVEDVREVVNEYITSISKPEPKSYWETFVGFFRFGRTASPSSVQAPGPSYTGPSYTSPSCIV